MVAGLLVVAVLDLDLAVKLAGIAACLLALPAIWMLPRQERTDARSRRDQVLNGVRSRKSVRQTSTRPISQRMTEVDADGDVEQSQ